MACCSVSIREPTVTLFQCNEAEIINCTFQAMKPPFPLQAPMGGCEIDESNSRRLNNMIADFDMFGLFFEKWTKMYVFLITFNKHPSKLVLTPLWWGGEARKRGEGTYLCQEPDIMWALQEGWTPQSWLARLSKDPWAFWDSPLRPTGEEMVSFHHHLTREDKSKSEPEGSIQTSCFQWAEKGNSIRIHFQLQRSEVCEVSWGHHIHLQMDKLVPNVTDPRSNSQHVWKSPFLWLPAWSWAKERNSDVWNR